MVDVAGVILAKNYISNILLFRVLNVIELILLSYAFFLLEKEKHAKYIIVNAFIIVIAIVIFGFFNAHDSKTFPTFFMALPNLFLFFISLREFYWTTISKVNPAKEAQLWFTLGFSFYFAINSIALPLWQGELIFIGTTISIVSNIIKNLIMAGSYICLLVQDPTLSNRFKLRLW